MTSIVAITSWFNPLGWRSRRRNYDTFRRHLGVPLVTVEWHPEGRFELGPGDADRVVRVAGGDLMWQKERLLEVALAHLPDDARCVAWVDAGVVFADPSWAERTVRALERAEVVQPFATARYLDAQATSDLAAGRRRRDDPPSAAGAPSTMRVAAERGVAALVEDDLAGLRREGLPGDGRTLPRCPGLAWAARRDVLHDVGLFDRAVIGSGDLLWQLAVLGVAAPWLEEAASLGFGYVARSRYLAWAARVAERVGGRVGWVEGEVAHLFHGHLSDRKYKARHRTFDALGLDVERDLRLDAGGAWALAERRPAWTGFFDAYFRQRQEDASWSP